MKEEFSINKDSVADLRYNLSYYGADYPVDALVKRMEEEEFIFPNFQRQYVWRIEEASKFIESLLLGLPVPSIFLAKDKYSRKLIVIDGQQRLRTLQFFYNGFFPDGRPFKLKNVIPLLQGKSYEMLALEDRFNLDNTIIHCLISSENENSDGIFYLFERLNTTGTPLTSQEIRNAIYHGPFNDQLHHLAKTQEWKNLYHKQGERMEDEELILRFLALAFMFVEYNGNLNDFLNAFMLRNRSFEIVSENQINKAFFSTMGIINSSIGENAFYYKNQFNKILFETLCLFLFQTDVSHLNLEKVKAFHRLLLIDDSFWQMAKNATTSKKNINIRLDIAHNIFDSLV